MSTTPTPRLDDRLNQLSEEVNSFFKMSYDPEKNKWKNLDSRLRFIEEHIGGVIIYDVLGETEGHDIQAPNMDGCEKAIYGKEILKKAVEVCDDNGIQASPVGIKDDLFKHNPNSHGSDITSEVRESDGKKAVTETLDILIPYLTDTVQKESGFSEKVKDEFLRLGGRLETAQKLLTNIPAAGEAKKRVTDAVSECFGAGHIFPEVSDYDYVLILPENPDETFVEASKPLTAAKWTIVADPGYAGDAMYKLWNEIDNGDINNTELTGKLSEAKPNWLFIRGSIRGTTKKEIRDTDKKLSSHPLRLKNIIIFDLCADKDLSSRTILKIWDMFNPNAGEHPSDKTVIFSVGKGREGKLENKLRDEGYVFKYEGLDLTPEDFVKSIVENRMLEPEYIYGGATTVRNPQRYLEAGIKFLDTDAGTDRKSIWEDFYSGRQITLQELEEDKDVHPRGKGRKLTDFQEKIKEALQMPESQVYTIFHQPGAGGTTVSRRLALDLERSMQNPGVVTAFISRYDPVRTVDMLSSLSEETGERTNIMIVLDDKEVSEPEFKNIRTDLRKKGVACVFLRLRHTISRQPIRPETELYLSSLTDGRKEKDRFDSKFSVAFGRTLSTKVIEEVLEDIERSGNKDNVEMIYYPYAFCERVREGNHNVSFEAPDSYVGKWLEAISSKALRDFCGFTALVYHFTASKGTDLYSLSSLWQKDDKRTLDAYPDDDREAMSNILKITQEESIEQSGSNLWAPRYAAFAEKILDTWRRTWRDTLSDLAITLIDAFPDRLIGRDHELLMDLFILQTQSGESVEERHALEDRFSPLVGHILSSPEGFDGASRIFTKLIEKYPDDGYYKIHFARLKFEYARSQKASPDDVNFKDAQKMINEVLAENDKQDDFQHIAGMYWRRIAKSIFNTYRDIPAKRDETIEDIREATDKALVYFNKCNELNHGVSTYGFVSTAELLCSTLKDVCKLMPREQRSDFLDHEPFCTYLYRLEETLTYLSRSHFEAELMERKDKIETIRNDYLKLLGDTPKALEQAKQLYENAEDVHTRKIFGHRTISLMMETENGDQKKSRFQMYSNMTAEHVDELTEILETLVADGDLSSAENLFHLYRYTRHEPLGDGKTFTALNQWHSMACSQGNLQHKLMASFYMYVSYAVRILNNPDDRDVNLENKYDQYRNDCRNLVESLNEERYTQIAFAGKDYIHTWDCIIDPAEAFSIDAQRQRHYSPKCRRVDAVIRSFEGSQGDCEIGPLRKISFSRKGIHTDSIGKKLNDGVVGFRFRGIGLYDFGAPTSRYSAEDIRTSSQQHPTKPAAAEKGAVSEPTDPAKVKPMGKVEEIFRTDSEKTVLTGPKVVAKIDLSKIRRR